MLAYIHHLKLNNFEKFRASFFVSSNFLYYSPYSTYLPKGGAHELHEAFQGGEGPAKSHLNSHEGKGEEVLTNIR